MYANLLLIASNHLRFDVGEMDLHPNQFLTEQYRTRDLKVGWFYWKSKCILIRNNKINGVYSKKYHSKTSEFRLEGLDHLSFFLSTDTDFPLIFTLMMISDAWSIVLLDGIKLRIGNPKDIDKHCQDLIIGEYFEGKVSWLCVCWCGGSRCRAMGRWSHYARLAATRQPADLDLVWSENSKTHSSTGSPL